MHREKKSDIELQGNAAIRIQADDAAALRKRIGPVVKASAQVPKSARADPPLLAIRARYGDGELGVEAREPWAISAVVVLVAITALAVLAGRFI